MTVAADGSCLGNPGPGGWAWALRTDCWAAGSHARSTNNLMELRAVFEAVRALPVDIPLTIQTDSKYVVGVFTEWLLRWEKRGWRTAANKPVANERAIREVQHVLAGRDVAWQHVRGHAGHEMNEFVDRRARAAAEAAKRREPTLTGDTRKLWSIVTAWYESRGDLPRL